MRYDRDLMPYDREVMPYDREVMPYDRATGYHAASFERYRMGEPAVGRGEYGEAYERPYAPYAAPYRTRFHGYGMGSLGGAMRSRGSFGAGQIRSGLNPHDEFEFRWGEGYVGGRGYGGTNLDYEHGYRTSAPRRREVRPEPGRRPRTHVGETPPERITGRIRGPARYGYGPYHDRLRGRRRSDEEIRDDVEEALFYDTWVDVDAIDVEVDDAVVTLKGTLPNFDEVRYATDDAWDVDGVRGVRTELEVEHTPVTDRLGRRREFTPGEIAAAHEAGGGVPAGKGAVEEVHEGGEPESGKERAGSEPEPGGPSSARAAERGPS